MVTTKATVVDKIQTDPLAVVISLVVVLLGQFGLFTYLGLDGNEVAKIGATITGIAAAVRTWWLHRERKSACPNLVTDEAVTTMTKAIEIALVSAQNHSTEEDPAPAKRRKAPSANRRPKRTVPKTQTPPSDLEKQDT